MAEFAPTRSLYARAGFRYRGPFGDYSPGPNSVFMTLDLVAVVEGSPAGPQPQRPRINAGSLN